MTYPFQIWNRSKSLISILPQETSVVIKNLLIIDVKVMHPVKTQPYFNFFLSS